MENEVKILFTSDIHLGITESATGIPDSSRVNTFRKISAIAKSHDILLIAGDLIDNTDIKNEMLDVIKAEFISMQNNNTAILYTPGPGELSDNRVIPSFLYDLQATHIFSRTDQIEPYEFSKEGQKIFFYGIPAVNGYDISKIKKASNEGFHIGLFHVDFAINHDNSGSSTYKLNKDDFKSLDLDFYALGHRHNFKMFKIDDKIIGAYPGSPEATSFDETGDRYAISLFIKNNQISQIRRLSVNTMKINRIEANCDEHTGIDQIIGQMENEKARNIIIKIFFSGKRNYIIDLNRLKSYENSYYSLDIIDDSIPSIDVLIQEYENENSIRGEFYRILKYKINNNNINRDEIDLENLALSLKTIDRKGTEFMEDWLCNSLNA